MHIWVGMCITCVWVCGYALLFVCEVRGEGAEVDAAVYENKIEIFLLMISS